MSKKESYLNVTSILSKTLSNKSKMKKKKILSIYSLYFINNILDKVSQITNKTNISNNKFSLYTIMINFNLIIYKNYANKFLLEKKKQISIRNFILNKRRAIWNKIIIFF